ncbi:MAG: succinylglutamate desuccinylase/aspartoacylase family protein [Proteobacteria bacterium]|nr:succinylglutamate desuccinylase/aspartoacylase family protein [Pseudomonadota bacterium]
MSNLELNQIDSFPQELLEISIEKLYTLFPGPTLLHLQGKRPEPVFVSVLLHGNEGTGLHVIQRLLKKYQHSVLPRSVSILFGNTQAARYGKRVLDSQSDYNRVWPGTVEPNTQETMVMRKIVNEMERRNVFASIDIHNNTGLNQQYSCINKLENCFLQLAVLFGHTVVYFLTPKGVQSMAFSKLCPAVTLECGEPGSPSGTDHALDYVDAVLHMKYISNDPILPQDIKLFRTVARVKVPEDVTFSFTDQNANILFKSELYKMNFSVIPADTCFGIVHSNNNARLFAFNDNEEELGEKLFYINNQQIKLTKPMMPAMLTLDEAVIRQDCFCYLMEQLPHPETPYAN